MGQRAKRSLGSNEDLASRTVRSVLLKINSQGFFIIVQHGVLENRIVQRLLAIDETHHPPGRRELIKTGIIEAFDALFEDSGVRPEIMDFVRAQTDSESRKTAKTVKIFLEKWGG